ncbi:MAG: hypothetical protein KIT72_06250 [Polyangiaceae bacterium]|nr:hypothetical protein [Polyangiaceae bacterium]MCW5790002.1 hypothetical protein [Polyangiaceae bacterium]
MSGAPYSNVTNTALPSWSWNGLWHPDYDWRLAFSVVLLAFLALVLLLALKRVDLVITVMGPVVLFVVLLLVVVRAARKAWFRIRLLPHGAVSVERRNGQTYVLQAGGLRAVVLDTILNKNGPVRFLMLIHGEEGDRIYQRHYGATRPAWHMEHYFYRQGDEYLFTELGLPSVPLHHIAAHIASHARAPVLLGPRWSWQERDQLRHDPGFSRITIARP